MITRRWDIAAMTLIMIGVCVGFALVIFNFFARHPSPAWPAFGPNPGMNQVANYSMKDITFHCDAAHGGIRLVILLKGNVNLVIYECGKDGWVAVPQVDK